MAMRGAKVKRRSVLTVSAADEIELEPLPWPQFSPYSMHKAYITLCSINSTTFLIEISDGRTLQVSVTNLGPVCRAGWREKRKFRIAKDGASVAWPELGYTVTLRELMGID